MTACTRVRALVALGAIGGLALLAGCGSAGQRIGSDDPGSEGGPIVASTDAESSEGGTSGPEGVESGVTGSGAGSTSGEPSDAAGSVDASIDAEDTGAIAEAAVAPVDAGPLGDSGGAAGCSGGMAGLASDANGTSSTHVSSYGTVEFNISTKNQIVALRTTLTVPPKPPASGTLFLWPGLQPLPAGQNYNPIGNGVLQPVLTWGGTCAPGAPNNYDSWWISGQYVNPTGPAGHTGCMGGAGTDVAVGDKLDIAMTLSGTVWTQLVTDEASGGTATFSIDMLGQAQDWSIFRIEMPDGLKPVSDVVFTSTTLTFAEPDQADCQPSVRGYDDYFSTPRSSAEGASCCVSRIILRGQGVAATTMNGP
jgi:hypothetical protein